MLKKFKQLFALALVLLTLGSVLLAATPQASAASVSYYQTSKSSVPIWSASNSSSTKIRTITTLGTVLKVVGSTTNSSGNLWYKLSDGYWVYSGNVVKHEHKYTGGYCTATGCDYAYPCTVTSFSGTFVVTNSSGAKIWNRPYSVSSTHVRTEAKNKVLSVTGKHTNADGNLWYKLSDGYWVYSGNVTQRFTISYNVNGGTGGPSSQTVLKGSKLTISSTKPSRVGYTFQGWGTSSSDTSVDYKPGTAYSFTSNKTLYAIWKTCSHSYSGGICTVCKYEYPYTVTSISKSFQVTNADGATLYNRPYSNNSTVISVKAKGTNLSIVGQTTNQAGNLWYKTSDGYWVYSGNLTERLTVKFNANGGTDTPPAVTVLKGTSITLPATTPKRVGYTLKGWHTAKTLPENTAYRPKGGKFTVNQNITLYALWETCGHSYSGGICKDCGYEYPITVTTLSKREYQVTNADGASIYNRPYSNNSTKISTEKNGTVLTITGKTTNQAGNLWYQLSNGNWVYSGNVTRRYSVKYNANGGENAPATQYFLQDKKLTLSSAKPTWVNHIFKGWGTSASDTTVDYKPGATYSSNKSITLYAIWSDCSHAKYSGGICTDCGYEYPLTITNHSAYYVVTNKDGCKNWSRPYSNNSTHVTTTAYGKTLTVVKKTVNKDGNTWYQLSNNNWIYSGNVTRAYKLTYNANGGSGVPSSVIKAKGTTFKLSTTEPTRTDYTFLGWATSSTGSVAYKAGASYTINADATLYAVWAKNVAISSSPSNQIVTAGTTAKFTVKATGSGLKYQWQERSTSSANWSNSIFSGATSSTLSVTAETSLNRIEFRCKVTDQYGNVAYSKAATLYALGIVSRPTTQYVKNGDNTTFSVKAVGSNVTYQWQFHSASSDTWANSTCEGNQTSTLKVQGMTGRNGHYFRCKITDSAGNVVYTKAVRFYVLGFKTQPTSQTVSSGEYAKFSVKATGSNVTYQWQFRTSSSGSWQNSTVSGCKTNAISVKGLLSRDGYQYRCKITDSAGNVLYSNIVNLNVK